MRPRTIELRTLAIASIASAVAATVTAQFWIRGTPIAAAMTPLIVALVGELLHRPTDELARRIGPRSSTLAEAAGAAPPPPSEETEPSPAPDPQAAAARRPGRRHVAWAAVLATGLLAFAIGAAALTLPELIAGQSIGKGDRRTSVFGGAKNGANGAGPAPAGERTVTETVPAETETTRTPTREGGSKQQDSSGERDGARAAPQTQEPQDRQPAEREQTEQTDTTPADPEVTAPSSGGGAQAP